MYGKLSVIKSYGERPVFVILDEDDVIIEKIPNPEDWLMKRLGTVISTFISDAHFQITDEEERKRQ